MPRSFPLAVLFRVVLRRPLATRSRLYTTSLLGPIGLQLASWMSRRLVVRGVLCAFVLVFLFFPVHVLVTLLSVYEVTVIIHPPSVVS